MTAVSFNAIPGNLLVPFFYAEVNSGGTPYAGQARQLLVGQKTSAGTAAENVPYGPIQSESDVIAQAGVGSMLHTMYNLAKRNAPFQPVYMLPLADPAGAAATGSISVNAGDPLGVTGAAIFRLMGRRIAVQAKATDTAAQTAAAIATAINAALLPIIAAVDGTDTYKVDLTARHVGALGNGMVVKVATDEPNAITSSTVTVTAMSGGSGTPALDTALGNLGDQEYDWIAGPYADTESLNVMRDFLNDVSGRWSPYKQRYGHYTTVMFDTLSNLTTFGLARNDQHASIMGSVVSPTPVWEWAAALAAQEVEHLSTAPELSRPLQTLVLEGVLPPDDQTKWFDTENRQALYSSGIGGYTVSADKKVKIDRLVTTYQTTAVGAPDQTFLDIETMAQAQFVPRYFRNAISNKYPRHSWADDNPFNVATIATPKDLRNTSIHAATDLCALGVMENIDLFAQALVIERDANNADRANGFLPFDVVNQLRIFAGNFTTYLQYRTASGQAAV
ncbi:MAG: hypothetical protein GC182_08545 [Rhodopseudomonas sp.]|nr:hypothetical protein [Rhodopseudomonas sp.]